MRVVVVGRWPSNRHERGIGPRGTVDDFRKACREVGGMLARHGHTLVVTSDVELTADREVANGYVDSVGARSSRVGRIEVLLPAVTSRDPFPELRKQWPWLFTRQTIHSRSMEVARMRVSVDSDATILIGGGAGTERTGHVALAARRTVIPIASFGGAAADFLAAVGQDRVATESMPGGLDQNVLSQDWSTHLADRLDAWFQRGRWGTGQDVFVVYGRNRPARDALFELLRALDLNPLEWSALVRGTGKTLPYVGDVLAHGFATAQACIVLVTGDEVVRLRRAFAEPHESVVAEFQPRPNVLFEAGMALASHPDRTLVVQLGPTRRLSDLAGRLFIEMVDPVAGRRAIADGLRVAGCQVRTDSDTWLESGDFASAIRLAQEAVTELSP